MGHCCSCVCQNRNVFSEKIKTVNSIRDDWIYVDFDSEITEFDEEDDATFMRDESLDELVSEFEDALFWSKRDKWFPKITTQFRKPVVRCHGQ
ncbi:hypothetical protein ABFA07_021888 [Porites harrisoni]